MCGREALADIREEENTRGLGNWMGKSRRPWGEKGKVVWPGGSRRRPMGVRWEIKTHCRTGKDGKVKLGGREALAVT